MAPEAYEKMRDKFIKDGLSKKDAQAKAAAIFNKQHPNDPVGKGKHEEVEETIILNGDYNDPRILEKS